MGKSQIYTDTDTDSSSVEAIKKKKNSILKYTGTFKKKKCKIHSRSEPEDSDYKAHKTHSNTTNYGHGHKKSKLRGILKHGREKEKYYSSSDQEEDDEPKPYCSQDRCLVGRVPPAGSKPGRGGGLAIIVKKSVKYDENKQMQQTKKKNRQVRLPGKRSY